MIALSRFRRFIASSAVIAACLLASLVTPSCDDGGRSCTLIGCEGHGLDIVFDGLVARGTTLQIQVALGEHPNSVPIIECMLAGTADANNDAGIEELFCNSDHWISQTGRTLNTHEILQTVRVTILSNGAQLSSQTFAPTYTRTEPNGPGCNVCVFSTIHVDLPQAAQP